MHNKILFLDRDGTLIRKFSYLCDPNKVFIEPGAIEALLIAQARGFELVIVTNQSAIGRGLCTRAEVEEINSKVESILHVSGIIIKEILICPHAPIDDCACRKPKTGLVEKYLTSEKSRPFFAMIGDQISDMEFGIKVGAFCILYAPGENLTQSAKGFCATSSWREIGVLIGQI